MKKRFYLGLVVLALLLLAVAGLVLRSGAAVVQNPAGPRARSTWRRDAVAGGPED